MPKIVFIPFVSVNNFSNLNFFNLRIFRKSNANFQTMCTSFFDVTDVDRSLSLFSTIGIKFGSLSFLKIS